MLGHISFGVKDLARSQAFYVVVMTALGYRRVFAAAHGIGYGKSGASEREDQLFVAFQDGPVIPPSKGFHLAFNALSGDAVDRFHLTALEFGGLDNGAPGVRPHYGDDYYAAFVIDPDGYRLEAKYPPAP